jgi:hypothetical protein
MFLQILIWVLAAAGCLVAGREIGKLIFKGKKSVTSIRKATQALSIELRKLGLVKLPEALEAVTVGEVDDLLTAIQNAAVIVKAGNSAIIQELEGTFERMLGAKIKTPEGRAAMRARIEAAEKIAIEVAKVAGPVVIAAVI